MSDSYVPRREDKFSFGLWTVGNRGRDPFGDAVRDPLPPTAAVAMLAEIGAWGVNLHDNDLVPIDATPAERDRIVKEFAGACERHGIVVPMVNSREEALQAVSAAKYPPVGTRSVGGSVHTPFG